MTSTGVERLIEGKPSRPERAVLLFGALGGPAMWAVHFFASYLYAPAVCAGAPTWGLHAITVATLLGTGLAAYVARGMYRGDFPRRTASDASLRYLGTVGLLLTALFAALIVFEGWPQLVVDPCVGLGA